MTTANPVAAVLVALALAAAACGGTSKQDQAKNTVCDARADIAKQIDTLRGMTPQTFSTEKLTGAFKAIGDDLSTIKSAQQDLSSDRRAAVKRANQQFEDQIRSIAGSLTSTSSLSTAASQLRDALQQLATTYKNTYAKIDC